MQKTILCLTVFTVLMGGCNQSNVVERQLTDDQKSRRNQIIRDLYEEWDAKNDHELLMGRSAADLEELISLADEYGSNADSSWYRFRFGEGNGEGDSSLGIKVKDGKVVQVYESIVVH